MNVTHRLLMCIVLLLLCSVWTGCEENTPNQGGTNDNQGGATSKVETVTATEISAYGAVLSGKVNADITQFSEVNFGMLYSTDKSQLAKYDDKYSISGKVLDEKDFSVSVSGLEPKTQYYYRAWLFVNGKQYSYGEIKSFATLEGAPVPADALTGVFSVGDTKKVHFSRGNLQYTQSTKIWSFAEHQYDMIGTDNVDGGTEQINLVFGYYYKYGDNLADKIDLFGWSGSTATAKWGISTSTDYDDYSGDFADWGTNIGDGKTWYTLTYDDWTYLIKERSNADQLIGVARINLNADGTKYVNGLILLPDTWICPAGVTFKSGFSDTYSGQAYADYQTFTLSDWQELEAADAVFLPASGDRNWSDVHDVQNVRLYGPYWSATAVGSVRAYNLYFRPDGAGTANGSHRHEGQAVRLVQDLD